MSDLLIKAEHVSKKFCRSLKRSLWYGVNDVAHSLNPWSTSRQLAEESLESRKEQLRPDEFWALQDLNFEVRRGECLGLIGHNGAGKSTLLKILNGLIRPDSGRITMRGRIGAMIELGAGFNPILTGRENIFNQAALLGFTAEEVRRRFDEIVDFAEIEEALDMPLQNYSSGMKVRLGFAVFAHLEPDVLLIDEVLAVGDVGFRFKSLNKMTELMSRCAVIFVTHTMPQIFRVCSEVILLDHGRISYQGNDLAIGVSKYFSGFNQGTQAVSGSGDCTIIDINAASIASTANMNETLLVPFGTQVEFHVRLKMTAAFPSAQIQLLFWNLELLPVMDIMTADLTAYPFTTDERGTAKIVVTVPQLILNAGKYNLSVIVLSPDLKTLCRHDGAIFVNVVANSTSGAHVISPGQFSTSTQKTTAS